MVVGADRRHLRPRRGSVEDRRARRRGRRLPDQAVRRRRAAGPHPRRALRHALAARIRQIPTSIVDAATCSIDLAGALSPKADAEVKLTKIEFDLLAALARNAGKVVTHRQLLKEVWGPHAVHEPHYVRVFMANLRKKLEDNPSRPAMLITEQGVGYSAAPER